MSIRDTLADNGANIAATTVFTVDKIPYKLSGSFTATQGTLSGSTGLYDNSFSIPNPASKLILPLSQFQYFSAAAGVPNGSEWFEDNAQGQGNIFITTSVTASTITYYYSLVSTLNNIRVDYKTILINIT